MNSAVKLSRKERREQRRDEAKRLVPPEGVPINFEIAGFGVRLGAQITDVLITSLGMAGILIFFAVIDIGFYNTAAVASLLFFFIRIPYYALSELLWNGQTLGKRLLKIKVVSQDGGPLTAYALIVRNLMKEAEIFLPGTLLLTLSAGQGLASWLSFLWVTGCVLVPLLNVRRRRLGDFIAGTYVIHLPQPILLKELVDTQTSNEEFQFLPHQLDHYGTYELQTLEQYLRALEKGYASVEQKQRMDATCTALVEKIRSKTGYGDRVEKNREKAFLRAFYKAQRAYLEQRQLFGDRRADKFHNEDDHAT